MAYVSRLDDPSMDRRDRTEVSGSGRSGLGSTVDKNQVDVLIHIRGSPSQLKEMFQGSPGGFYGTRRSIGGNSYSLSEPDYSRSSGEQLREVIECESRDPKIRKAHKKQSNCGGCCIIFHPLVKLVDCLSLVLTCCF